ncbi:MAG TPA: hypothetical protein VNH11_33870 [Pirellulales bacterium]|nr:hypothetical protein [Pirellulales bacterium]
MGTVEAGEDEKGATQVLILAPAPLDRDGAGRWAAWRIVNPKVVAKIESFFPRYRARAAGKQAGAWETAWEVYFDLPNGESVHLSVSGAEEAAWSTGNGDLRVQAEFYRFVEELTRRHEAPAAVK